MSSEKGGHISWGKAISKHPQCGFYLGPSRRPMIGHSPTRIPLLPASTNIFSSLDTVFAHDTQLARWAIALPTRLPVANQGLPELVEALEAWEKGNFPPPHGYP